MASPLTPPIECQKVMFVPFVSSVVKSSPIRPDASDAADVSDAVEVSVAADEPVLPQPARGMAAIAAASRPARIFLFCIYLHTPLL